MMDNDRDNNRQIPFILVLSNELEPLLNIDNRLDDGKGQSKFCYVANRFME